MLAASVTVIVQLVVTAQLFGICPTKKEKVCSKPEIIQCSFLKCPANSLTLWEWIAIHDWTGELIHGEVKIIRKPEQQVYASNF